jgi:NADH-quinone oxidoreductase subunit G
MSDQVRLVLGPVPVVGDDDTYPKDVRGNPVEPVRFTIRAEKCPNRRGVKAVLRHLQGEVIPFSAVANDPTTAAMWFAGGYRDPAWVEAAIGTEWKAPPLLVVQDFFPTVLSAAAAFVLPATTAFEKDGTFVNHAGLAQTFARSARPPAEVRSELQLAFDLAGRKGLATAAAVRAELAKAIPEFAGLTAAPKNGARLELETV